MTSLSTASSTALTQLSARSTLPLVSQVAIKVAYLCLLWSQRSRTRYALRDLPEATLRDIGITSDQARHEANKWFWRP